MAELLRESDVVLTRYVVGDATMGETLGGVCDLALDAIGPAAAAGISMTLDGELGTYVVTGLDVSQIDRAQYDTGDGPCVDAFRRGEVVMLSSMEGTGPYAGFRAAAAEHGVHSVLSVPLIAGRARVGALNLYAPSEHAFDDDADVATAQSFSAQAAFLLVNAQAYGDVGTLSEDLAAAMLSRAVIEQAKGMLMNASACDPDEAFEQLVRESRHLNVTLRDLATQLVDQATYPPAPLEPKV